LQQLCALGRAQQPAHNEDLVHTLHGQCK
jgi:hypothetical protein